MQREDWQIINNDLGAIGASGEKHMNSIMGLSQADCKGCYKCIRGCPVKSLSCRDEQVKVMDGECIYCGRCLLICPQNAKYIRSDVQKVKDAIAAGEKVYASLDRSCLAAFPHANMGQMIAALRKIGFVHAELATLGAAQVTHEYDRLALDWKAPNFITTACPSVYLLVQRHYPELVSQLAPVVSFFSAHARIMKQIYGSRARVVSFGSCISAEYDAQDAENGKSIFASLTFADLVEWFHEAGVQPEKLESIPVSGAKKGYFSRPGGIIHNLSTETRHQWECVALDGMNRCTEVLDSLKKGDISGYLLELSACAGGCLGGPILRMLNVPFLVAKNAVVTGMNHTMEGPPSLTEGVEAGVKRTFRPLAPHRRQVSEEEIRTVLSQMGKTTKAQELNCGSCGYDTCREKALAVIRGKADVRMCMPYMRELAETMSATVVENIPTGVLILDEKLRIEHINPAAISLLRIKTEVKGKSIGSVLPNNDFYEAFSTGKNVVHHKVRYDTLDIVVSQTVICARNGRMTIVLLEDITNREIEEERNRNLTGETVQSARAAVDKQMQVVQEIAGMLGETAAETKMAFTKLADILDKQTGASS